MTGVRGLHRIHRENPDGVGGALLLTDIASGQGSSTRQAGVVQSSGRIAPERIAERPTFRLEACQAVLTQSGVRMATPSFQITVDCTDPDRMARFWALALSYSLQGPPDGFDTWSAYWVSVGVPEDEVDDGFDAIVDLEGL